MFKCARKNKTIKYAWKKKEVKIIKTKCTGI